MTSPGYSVMGWLSELELPFMLRLAVQQSIRLCRFTVVSSAHIAHLEIPLRTISLLSAFKKQLKGGVWLSCFSCRGAVACYWV